MAGRRGVVKRSADSGKGGERVVGGVGVGAVRCWRPSLKQESRRWMWWWMAVSAIVTQAAPGLGPACARADHGSRPALPCTATAPPSSLFSIKAQSPHLKIYFLCTSCQNNQVTAPFLHFHVLAASGRSLKCTKSIAHAVLLRRMQSRGRSVSQ